MHLQGEGDLNIKKTIFSSFFILFTLTFIYFPLKIIFFPNSDNKTLLGCFKKINSPVNLTFFLPNNPLKTLGVKICLKELQAREN